MEPLIHYFRFGCRMRRKTFLLILAAYLATGIVLSFTLIPIPATLGQAPISYFIIVLVSTIAVIPAYAARLMDMATPPFIALLFLLPPAFNFAQKSGMISLAYNAYLHVLMNVIGLLMIVSALILATLRGTKSPNRYGPDPVGQVQ